MVAVGEASDDGVPVVGGGGLDLQENVCGEVEVAEGGEGAEVEEFCAWRGGEVEEAGGEEEGLELFDVSKGGAFGEQRLQKCGHGHHQRWFVLSQKKNNKELKEGLSVV